jgi:hypothetical protein
VRRRGASLLRVHGAYVTEACDRCGAVLRPIRWTILGEPGAWCSQKCRDGIERQAGMCQGCGVSLQGKRKGARFCSDVCRMRQRVLDRPSKPKTKIQNTALTGAIPRFGCKTLTPTYMPLKRPAIAISRLGHGDSGTSQDVNKQSVR